MKKSGNRDNDRQEKSREKKNEIESGEYCPKSGIFHYDGLPRIERFQQHLGENTSFDSRKSPEGRNLQSIKTVTLLVPRIDLAYYYKALIENQGSITPFSGFLMELIPLHDLELIKGHYPSAVISLIGEKGLERFWRKNTMLH